MARSCFVLLFAFFLNDHIAAKWQSRKAAIDAIGGFCNEPGFSVEAGTKTSIILTVVQKHTKGFKESNFNVAKAIMSLMSALCEKHFTEQVLFPTWAAKAGCILGTEKISDKKLSMPSKSLLTTLVSVTEPVETLQACFIKMETIRSPVAREGFLVWLNGVLDEFGAQILTPALKDLIEFLVKVRLMAQPRSSWLPTFVHCSCVCCMLCVVACLGSITRPTNDID